MPILAKGQATLPLVKMVRDLAEARSQSGEGDAVELLARLEAEDLKPDPPVEVVSLLGHVAAAAAGLEHPAPSYPVFFRAVASYPGASTDGQRRLQDILASTGFPPLFPSKPRLRDRAVVAGLGFGYDLTREVQPLTHQPYVGLLDALERIHAHPSPLRDLLKLLIAGLNPVLAGEPGVGKSALVEGLAWATSNCPQRIPASLRGRRVIALSGTDLRAGTSSRGKLEERIKALLAFLRANSEVLPFVDEIHALVSGDGESQIIISELKPELAREGLQLVGATTFEEYQKYFLRDRALKERFRAVAIEEPRVDEAIAILQGRPAEAVPAARKLGLKIDPDAVEAAVRLSARHLRDERLPQVRDHMP